MMSPSIHRDKDRHIVQKTLGRSSAASQAGGKTKVVEAGEQGDRRSEALSIFLFKRQATGRTGTMQMPIWSARCPDWMLKPGLPRLATPLKQPRCPLVPQPGAADEMLKNDDWHCQGCAAIVMGVRAEFHLNSTPFLKASYEGTSPDNHLIPASVSCQAQSPYLPHSGGVDVHFSGAVDCFRQIVKAQGVLGLWNGLTANLLKRS
ncbi:hypothetical protein P7K49_038988 [Saguinus oedipus]|uniref:Uncharacterized protein n=1 Tax=Saguinus oedipus TaxID=9490 RepID=A0ABQ9THS4_SAGOE|nr:hypothetical protein P7K49_038988 [Saguinus oedipus]